MRICPASSRTFRSWQRSARPRRLRGRARCRRATDWQGNGNGDATVQPELCTTGGTTSSGGVRPMTGNGKGTFSAGAVVPAGSSPGANAIAAADLDADGYDDLVLTNRGSGTLTVVPNGL
ncbi:FG-GAP-like repeat-containing protein [Sorangium sp. So ce448]|uniref:FG-GAP-like repeat-containing protein n=1 Tax=Sorangium sp. So ce448 TaxID=3133314 RepID=UPI003F61A8F1